MSRYLQQSSANVSRRSGIRMAAPALASAVALGLLSGCHRASQSDPPSLGPLEPTALFSNGSSARPLVTGVVPRPVDQSPGIPYCAVNDSGPANMQQAVPAGPIPFPVTNAVLARGQERFDIYCSMCHGRSGEGNGIIVQRGFSKPPSYYSKMLLDAPDSHFYNVITNGHGAMFSFNSRIAPRDRWAIVAYIRSLQEAARQASPDMRPASYGKGPVK